MEKGFGGRDKAPAPAGRWCAASFPSLLPPPQGSRVHRGLPPRLSGFCLLSQYPALAPGSPSEETPWLSFQAGDILVDGGSRSPVYWLASVSVVSSLSHLLMEASVCLVTFISSFLVLSSHKEVPVNPSSAAPGKGYMSGSSLTGGCVGFPGLRPRGLIGRKGATSWSIWSNARCALAT